MAMEQQPAPSAWAWNGTAWVPVAVARPRSTAALVCGIVGVVLGLIPLLFIAAWILGLIALVLGVIGWRERRRLARAATVLGVVAIALGFVGIVVLSSAVDELDKSIDCISGAETTSEMAEC